MNELLLIASVIVIFGAVLFSYMLFGRAGLYCANVIATVVANIEIVIMVKAFGLEQTLGNVLFAATFLITDILSECEGRAAAQKAVCMGIFCQVFFLVLSQLWLLYTPAAQDGSMPAVKRIFSQTPRLIAASLAVYVVSQLFDVWLYHKWWDLTNRRTGDKSRFLWLRNNGSTMVSQLINSLLFTVLAFAGTYDIGTMFSIFGSSYIIFLVAALLDTPVLYFARHLRGKTGDSDRAKAD